MKEGIVTLRNRSQLDSAVATLQHRFGQRVFLPAPDLRARPSSISTDFPALDQILGIGGVPLNVITLLTGQMTSGKLTLAYKILGNAQQTKMESPQPVALFDLTVTTDGDYLQRCGIDLEHLLVVRDESIRSLLDLVRSRQVRAILLDHLSILRTDHEMWKHFSATLAQLNVLLKNSNCAIIFLDESSAPLRPIQNDHTRNELGHAIALHLDLQREQWIRDADELCGYQARVRVLRNRFGLIGQSALIAIEFNGTVRAKDRVIG